MDEILKRKKVIKTQKTVAVSVALVALVIIVVIVIIVLFKRPQKSHHSSSLLTADLMANKSHAEVFLLNEGNSYNFPTADDADDRCSQYGARLATYDELADAWKHGANWCAYGFVADGRKMYPISQYTNDCDQDPGIIQGTVLSAGATCYGSKPKYGTPGVYDFKPGQYSMYDLSE